ncbi:hypothetical protein TYRP_019989 [Tyrophagus putrescentiae]|nr:hypothetical protein TYRP_019989 [Tyrophagus putrescentiae]
MTSLRMDNTCQLEMTVENYVPTDKPTCALCSQVIITYGLLENCQDAFCEQCINRWRQWNVSDLCPVCGLISTRTMQSSRWIQSKSVKRQIIDGIEYKRMYIIFNRSPYGWFLCSLLFAFYLVLIFGGPFGIYTECCTPKRIRG